MDCVIEKIATEILDVCGDDDEVCALIDNVLLYIADLVCDEDWQPESKDLRQSIADKKDDLDSDLSADDEDIEVICDDEGFMSLR
tara:strand:+ start:5348 stop:5602 length:255 start_codon:yes stop_codon:yes gene_type:complete